MEARAMKQIPKRMRLVVAVLCASVGLAAALSLPQRPPNAQGTAGALGAKAPAGAARGVLIAVADRAAGTVRLAASWEASAGTSVALRVVAAGAASGAELAVLAKGVAAANFSHSPGPGLWQYSLDVGGSVVATATADLRPRATLTFIGGSAKRAVFEITRPGEPTRHIIVRPGGPITGVTLDDSGAVVDVSAPVTLDAVEIAPSTRPTTRQSPLTDQKHAAITGVDGKPVSVEVPVLIDPTRAPESARASGVITALLTMNGLRVRMQEYESLELPPEK
jgi:hypothetical protein